MVVASAQVSGLPNPELMWLRNGRPMVPDLRHRMLVRENGVHSLLIDPLTKADAGTFTCIATNKAGQNSFSLELTVMGKTFQICGHFSTILWHFPSCSSPHFCSLPAQITLVPGIQCS